VLRGAFVVRGEAGIGKTALLKYLTGQSGECLIVRAVGVETGIELPFAILHQLYLPMHDRGKQRRAMSTTISKFDLWSHDVARLSEAILARLRDGWMPCDGAWADERIALFQDGIAAGKPA
jgi:hypothetical protein